MPLTILLINEDEALCTLVCGVLVADGHTVVCARGWEAMKVVAAQMPDLIILEISSEKAGALEIKQRLGRLEETRQMPVIVISEHPELEYELLKVFDFIPKPVDTQRLREDIDILRRGEKRRRPAQIEPLGNSEYRLFYEYLLTFSGLHFERRNLKILERGLHSRMTALRIGSYLDYYDYLIQHRESRQELQKLLQYLTVGETYFFRYRAHFEALRRFLVSDVAPDRKRPLRLWSAGCSTGEEPYSMAMTIMEALPDWRERDIRIYATDINNRALRRARDGVYGAWALRATDKNHLDRYFDRVGKSYLLRNEVKELVEFSHLNLQTDAFPVPGGTFHDLDVIFCRNVMIYFTVATTREIVEKFADSLVPDGFLFLGHAETLAYISTRFERHTQDGGFYYRRKSPDVTGVRPEPKPASVPKASLLPPQPPARPVLQPPVRPLARPVAAEEPRPDLNDIYRRATALFDAERFGEASQLLNEILRHQADHEGALVLHGFILANNGHFDEALKLCAQLQDVNDLLPEGYFLKGLILDMLDRVPEAVEEYRKAILLRMEFVMPHYHLGRLHIRQGKIRAGERELRNCLKILEKGGVESVVPHSGGLTREVFLEQLRNELARVAQERGRR